MSGRSDGQPLNWPSDLALAMQREADALPGKIAELQEERKQPIEPAPGAYPNVPPARVSSDPNHRDFHPSCKRIAVLVDGVARNDVHWYDAPAGVFRIVGDGRNGQLHSGQVVVYWRWAESRQERRARERWDSKHPQPVSAPVPVVKSSEAQWPEPPARTLNGGISGAVALASLAAVALSSGAG